MSPEDAGIAFTRHATSKLHDEKATGNTLCISKVFEDAWALFMPVKTVCVLVSRG